MTAIRVRRVKLSFGIYGEIFKSRREKIYEYPNTLRRLVFILNPSDRTTQSPAGWWERRASCLWMN